MPRSDFNPPDDLRAFIQGLGTITERRDEITHICFYHPDRVNGRYEVINENFLTRLYIDGDFDTLRALTHYEDGNEFLVSYEYRKTESHRDNLQIWVKASGGHKNLHREDGPAQIRGHSYIDMHDDERYSTEKLWCKDGEIHRIDGPAATYHSGTEEEFIGEDWYLNGEILDLDEMKAWVFDNNLSVPFDSATQVAFVLKFSGGGHYTDNDWCTVP